MTGILSSALVSTNPPVLEPEPKEASNPEEYRRAPRAVVLCDYDADGLNDIYALNPHGEDRLFRNAGDGSFVDVTVDVGLAGLTGTREVLFADCDGDHLQDLLVLGATEVRLLRNIGGTFVDDTTRSGLDIGGWFSEPSGMTSKGMVFSTSWCTAPVACRSTAGLEMRSSNRWT